MGIRGLMTYINRNPNFFEPYELNGGYLVIDGHSLAAQLYISSRCNCAFGGDHDRYARFIGEFFDDLDKCNVTPLVILDGGMESKKMKTAYSRMVEKLKSAMNYTPASQTQIKFMPMAMMIVFNTVLKQRGINLVRSAFEADPVIAGVAKVLNCPVLSYDSDFFIFGVMYIPINTLEPYIVKSSQVKGYAKRCKLYRVENLLRSFPGLDASVLPLAAILLGNDYVESKTFKNFFQCLKLSNQNQRLYNEGQRRIHTTLRWLKNYNLNDAVGAILSKLPKKHRQKVLETIEVIVNGYLCLPCELLVPLGLNGEYANEMNTRRNQKKFKFQGNVSTLESRQLWRNEQNIVPDDNSSSDEEAEKEEATLEFDVDNESDDSNEAFAKSWPDWFAHHSSIADFPTYFIDMMRQRLFTVPVQIENFNYPSAYEISLKIVGVIDGLLVAGRKESAIGLSYIIRDGTKFIRRRVDTVRGTKSTKFPALSDLRDTPINIRKQIFDDTLEIFDKQSLMNEIPSEWRVYVAAIFYWMRQSDDKPSRNSCHLYAVLFTMLFGVVDRKIGYHRSLQNFNKVYKRKIAEIESKRKSKTSTITETMGNSITKALEAISENDCIVAAPFFISNFAMDHQLYECPRKFNVTVVHAFSQLQSCVRHAIHLNVLLGCPYEYPIIADLYNGTMLYNLYTNFLKRSDAETYISVILENSPSLLHLLKLLIAKVKEILSAPIAHVNKSKGTKRQRNKKKTKEEDLDEDSKLEMEVESEKIHPDFVDPQNLFSVLDMIRGCQKRFPNTPLDVKEILRGINIVSPQSSEELLSVINGLKHHLSSGSKIRVVILDSLSLPVQCSLVDGWQRTQFHFRILNDLQKIATRNNVAVSNTYYKHLIITISSRQKEDLKRLRMTFTLEMKVF